MFETNSLGAMRLGRLNAALDKQYRFNGRVRSLRDHIVELAKQGPLDLSESDGMTDYSRHHFNRISSQKEQDAYIARLKAKRYFYVNGWVVPNWSTMPSNAKPNSLSARLDRSNGDDRPGNRAITPTLPLARPPP